MDLSPISSPNSGESTPERTRFRRVRTPYRINTDQNKPEEHGSAQTSGKIWKGVGGEKKIRGRSPVPSTGTIIEPHTDKFPSTAFSPLPEKFPEGVGVKNRH